MTSVEDVAVGGARLYTETRGSGPLLLCVVGGNGDPTVFGPLADLLAMRERWPANNAFWFEHEYGPYPVHELDLAALRRHAGRLGYLEEPAGFAAALEHAVGLLAWEP